MSDLHGPMTENLLAALPQVLQEDDDMRALAESIAGVLSARPSEIDRLRIYAEIDRLPEELLDELAHDFKVDWWDGDYSIEQKRQTLKASWQVHRSLGTKAAVQTALSAVYPDTQVQEWFEYGGQPYAFRLQLDAVDIRTDDTRHAAIMNRVGYYKNLRSHLDGITWDYTLEPFVNEPDDFGLHQLVLLVAFSNERNFAVGAIFDGSVLFDGRSRFGKTIQSLFGFPLFEATVPIAVSTEHLDASLTIDNMYHLDGSVAFDGSRKFNAAIKKEDL